MKDKDCLLKLSWKQIMHVKIFITTHTHTTNFDPDTQFQNQSGEEEEENNNYY